MKTTRAFANNNTIFRISFFVTVSNRTRNLKWHLNLNENRPLFAVASWLSHEKIIVKEGHAFM
jgi:hypothetical protein